MYVRGKSESRRQHISLQAAPELTTDDRHRVTTLAIGLTRAMARARASRLAP
jgi:hypothetical protein